MERGICPIAVLYFSVERSCFYIPEILRHRSVTNRLEVGSCLVGFFEEREKCDAGNYRPVSLTSVTFLECHGVKSKFCTALRTFHNVFVVTDNYAVNIYQ